MAVRAAKPTPQKAYSGRPQPGRTTPAASNRSARTIVVPVKTTNATQLLTLHGLRVIQTVSARLVVRFAWNHVPHPAARVRGVTHLPGNQMHVQVEHRLPCRRTIVEA